MELSAHLFGIQSKKASRRMQVLRIGRVGRGGKKSVSILEEDEVPAAGWCADAWFPAPRDPPTPPPRTPSTGHPAHVPWGWAQAGSNASLSLYTCYLLPLWERNSLPGPNSPQTVPVYVPGVGDP